MAAGKMASVVEVERARDMKRKWRLRRRRDPIPLHPEGPEKMTCLHFAQQETIGQNHWFCVSSTWDSATHMSEEWMHPISEG